MSLSQHADEDMKEQPAMVDRRNSLMVAEIEELFWSRQREASKWASTSW